jgi:HAE1 family hydrophobic/amphiphilic exporter-1
MASVCRDEWLYADMLTGSNPNLLLTLISALMETSWSFILGILPLVFASGAGYISQNSLGVSLIGGLLCVLLVGTLLVPGFYAMVQRRREKLHGGSTKLVPIDDE